MKSIDQEEFFKKIAVNAGIRDLDTVRDFYYGMIRTISRELKERQIVRLPDWGDFNLKVMKERRTTDVNTKAIITLPAKTLVKFSPDYKVKRYFHSFGEQGL